MPVHSSCMGQVLYGSGLYIFMPLTKQQAQDAYISSSQRYARAMEDRTYWSNQEQSLRAQKQNTASQISTARSERINFEKRLEGIEKIIRTLEGNGGLFNTTPPQAIEKANSVLESANQSYQSCIRLSGGSSAANMRAVFQAKTVDMDPDSAEALRAFKSEQQRLREAIQDLAARLNALSSQMDSLSSQINNASAQQRSARSAMLSNAYDMARYRNLAFG